MEGVAESLLLRTDFLDDPVLVEMEPHEQVAVLHYICVCVKYGWPIPEAWADYIKLDD